VYNVIKTRTANAASVNLEKLIDETATSHEPILITNGQRNAILLSEVDWSSLQETIYLSSSPGMRESIRERILTPLDKCDDELDW